MVDRDENMAQEFILNRMLCSINQKSFALPILNSIGIGDWDGWLKWNELGSCTSHYDKSGSLFFSFNSREFFVAVGLECVFFTSGLVDYIHHDCTQWGPRPLLDTLTDKYSVITLQMDSHS